MQKSLEQTAHTAIELLKKYKVSDYELLLDSSSGVSTAVRLGEVETLQYHLDKGFEVNVFFGKKKGHASSVDVSKDSLDKTIKSACLIAKYTQDDPFNGLAPKALMAFDAPDLDLYHPWDLDAQHSIDIAKACEEAALAQDEIDNSEGAEVSSFQGEGLYANSNGLIITQSSTRHSLNCALIAKRDDDMQTAYEYTTALDANTLETPQLLGKKAAKLAQQKLGARSLASQKCPVIFTPRVSGGLFSQLLGALGGSRQYKKSTFLLNSIDKIVLPEDISFCEHPFAKKTLGAKAIDRDGVLKREQYFIEDGRVKSYIMGQYSANQLGLQTTANAGGVSNGIVESSFNGGLDEMIKVMDKGLIVTELMGQGVNGTTGDYSRGALGFWVENGEIQYPVSGLTIAGNLKDMLLGIVHVGNDVDQRNNIKVGSVLINQMTVAGES
ncbi:TldE protein, part of TldE/TldD proteolytic complex [uncultured Gammaproteobacteria bacterium]|jgi:PmbA protein|uniref:metalloprotease PmbA n=1 Tax=thiotrophic endosymbiont of Bathymodiolus puteoserpentis (Logatchev) TaxID=343240 RepID=UPI0010B5D193|nr:metalloprotease PmbA [thiotrophic endosymbiont of Bathymodiolus puteoserpentis (Logatchev)]CAC9489787.1 TldE protein, part of TldE/TldD proteolytic complex [uncultured Gammaproteobacteria bacterium]CAC9580474.1 TldE protein, part of TldE/TldD proteolytic complex [uncultured Gammaproteobacteria bacterium]CAC9583905.1 TldE protein, part of TldE/TldD proteolytic complex [uncultured Gammaproteobacteria bacterium]CAC9585008.1 TldE protein, part of TldE/TldD proteolytic complex [uncultured Gammapr